MGHHGAASMLLGEEDFPKLQAYVKHIRPALDPSKKLPYLLLLTGPRQIERLSVHVKRLGEHYHIKAPSSTCTRKIGATTTALQCTEVESNLITQQLAHSLATDSRFYRAIKGPQHAADAFQAMEGLPKGGPEKQKQKRAHYTEEEAEAIELYFEDEICAECSGRMYCKIIRWSTPQQIKFYLCQVGHCPGNHDTSCHMYLSYYSSIMLIVTFYAVFAFIDVYYIYKQ